MFFKEKRKNDRIETHFGVRFYEQLDGDDDIDWIHGVVKNCNAGGLYVETKHPPLKNTIITIEFEFSSDSEQHLPHVRATAIVRWSKMRKTPKGMGVSLIDFEDAGSRNFSDWLTQLCQLLQQQK